jgi:DNA topoisomerase III
MKLIIAEKPQLARVIADALGIISREEGYIKCRENYTVTWALGHILEIKKPEELNPNYKLWKTEDLPLKVRPLQLKPIPDKIKQFNIIKDLLKKADIVVNAGDPDDEGQLLIREILDYLKFKGDVKRVLLNDLNIEAAKKAMLNLKPDSDFNGMYYKALARSQADYIFGLNLTRAYTLVARSNNLSGVYSIGRVQTPTLGLIVRRFLDNKNHKASYYYNLNGKFDFGGKLIEAELIITDDIVSSQVIENSKKKQIIDEKIANEIATICENQVATILNSSIEYKSKIAPLPFALLDLQTIANNRHGYSADETLKITQTLREKHKAITYNRSDCRYLSSEQFEQAPQTLNFLKKVFPELPFNLVDEKQKSRAFNDNKITAHTGIIPVVPDDFKLSNLSDKERNIYQAIVEQYLIQFLPEKKYNLASISIQCGNYQYKTSATMITDYGWSKLVSDQAEDDSNNTHFDLVSSLQKGEDGTCECVNVHKAKTKPLPLYTDATLLKDLQRIAQYVENPKLRKLLIEKDKERGDDEKGGIGTPATRGAIIKNLNDKGFFEYHQKKIIPTQKGIEFINALPHIVTVPDTTALWFEQQLEIEQGKLSLDEFLNKIEEFVTEQVELAKNVKLELKGEPCNICGNGVMVLKNSKDNKSKFFSCSNYPECKSILPALNNNIIPSCPCCNKTLKTTSKTIYCDCGLTIWRNQLGKELSDTQLLTLLTKGKTGIIKGFISKAGKEFEAKLILDKANKKISLDFNKKR